MSITIWLKKFFRGFAYAGRGIPDALQERNMKVHLVAAVGVVALGLVVTISRVEWMILLLCIAGVMSLEMVNTALEEIANLVRDTDHLAYEATRRMRDVAAGAVLIMAIASAIIGGLIFLPKI